MESTEQFNNFNYEQLSKDNNFYILVLKTRLLGNIITGFINPEYNEKKAINQISKSSMFPKWYFKNCKVVKVHDYGKDYKSYLLDKEKPLKEMI